MMLRKTLMSLLAVGVMAATPVLAQEGHEGAAPEGKKMEFKNPADTDGDGFLSRAEFDAANAKRFAEMDTNGDGKISKEEHKAHRDSKRSEFKEKRKEWKEKHQQGNGEHPADAPAGE